MSMMRFYSSSLMVVAGAATSKSNSLQLDDGDGLSLLQIASAKQHFAQNTWSRVDGVCEFDGDTHALQGFGAGGGHVPDPQQFGLFDLATSKDGRFKIQAYQCAAHQMMSVGWLNAMALDVDGTRIVIPPPPVGEFGGGNDPFNFRANDVEYSTTQLPFTIPGTSINLQAHRANLFHIVTDGLDVRIELKQIPAWKATWLNTRIAMDAENVPDVGENSFCGKGAAATPIADDALQTDWSATLFTNADHQHICDFCDTHNQRARAGEEILQFKCVKPPPVPPAPPAKKECEQNECSWTHAQQLCRSLKEDDTLYNDCLFDFCLLCEDEAAIAMVENDEEDHPVPVCVQGATECLPEEVCTKAISMNTLTVSQNNLGGVGPDDGAEEIRYSNAAVVGGRAVDLVLTTDSKFQSSKPSVNGNAGAFGVLNVKCGTSVSITMSAVDSETGAPVTLDSVALTWYDLDEGKKGKGRATVQTCGSTGAMVSANTELTVQREGECSSTTSSVAGNGKDNPNSPHTLTSLQISRSVTLPFKDVSEITTSLSLAKGFKGRNFLFALEPTVACGL